MNAKHTKKSLIHENAEANITSDFGDGDISPYRSRFPHSSIIVRCTGNAMQHRQLVCQNLHNLSQVMFTQFDHNCKDYVSVNICRMFL